MRKRDAIGLCLAAIAIGGGLSLELGKWLLFGARGRLMDEGEFRQFLARHESELVRLRDMALRGIDESTPTLQALADDLDVLDVVVDRHETRPPRVMFIVGHAGGVSPPRAALLWASKDDQAVESDAECVNEGTRSHWQRLREEWWAIMVPDTR
jgi:hypothetical protein